MSTLPHFHAGDLEALWNSSKADLAAGNALLAAIASENDEAALLSAIEGARALIQRGAPLLGTSEMPLHAAVRAGRLVALRALLAAGAPLEAKDGNGRTALQVGGEGVDGFSSLRTRGRIKTGKFRSALKPCLGLF